ncbi:ABC transporter ATP-binding protein [Paraburkholderia sp. JHI2823]|uniref:ABC transporter ATP-binding protein n=1 Tax=Paraburkholderia sp. JHI2823 TaxID=3112960 RepID=UPI00319EA70A
MVAILQAERVLRSSPPAPSSSRVPTFHVSHLSKIYDTDAGQVHALDDVSLDIPQGTFVTIVGASGCGKSSLLKILAGLELATDGIALRYDRELDGPSRDVGIAFQEHVLFPWLTVLENVMLPADIYQLPRQEANGRAQALLEMSGLKGFENRKPHNLSGGMKQRAALCRALLTDPEVLLLDEPFGALDALTREELSLELLRIWEATRKTALLITHDINEAVMLSDTIVVMSRRPGRIVEIIPVDLPRPRGPQSELHPRFREIAHHIRELIFARRSN